jgi:glycerate 2-kinase
LYLFFLSILFTYNCLLPAFIPIIVIYRGLQFAEKASIPKLRFDMTILIAPDKFKGSLDTFALCNAMEQGVYEADPAIRVIKLPLADGGDGFAKVLAHYLGTKTVTIETTNAIGKPIMASYEWDENNKTAIIDLASASGIALLPNQDHRPLETSTRGTGQLVKHALEKGAKQVILGIGGSATNDGGTGLLAAMGYRFLDKQQNELMPCGGNLGNIETIIPPQNAVTAVFTIACDVNNPLLGKNGAAHTYAAQKGASPAEIEVLETGMQHFATVIEKFLGKSVSAIPGTGAAGGTTAGLLLLPIVTLHKGTDIVLQYSNFYLHLRHADLVLTGEGCFDAQTLQGKVVFAVAQACKEKGIPSIAICGKVDADEATLFASGLSKVFGISNDAPDSFVRAGELVREKVRTVLL